MQSSKNSLAASLGNAGRKVWESHRNDETTYALGGGDLPPGIEDGVAQLTECKFDVYKEGDNRGKWYFYAHGVVVSPDNHEGVSIQGKLTKIIEPLHDTPNRKRATVEDHLSWIMNELRKLGLDTSGIDFDDLDAAVASLKEAAPMFSFRTWASEATKEYPNPRTNHQWGGVTEHDLEEEDAVEEEEEKPVPKTTSKKEKSKEEPKSVKSIKSSLPKTDYDVKAADEGDEDEQIKINEKAEALGIDSNDYATWTEVHEAIIAANSKDSTEESEEDEEEEGEEYKKSEEYNLGLSGDKGDEDAQTTLSEYASRFNIDPDDYETWVDVALALLDAQENNSEKYEKKEEEEESEETSDFPYAGLGELGDEGDEEAQSKLAEGCQDTGIDPDDYETWVEVEELLLERHNNSETASFTPEKGEVYLWKPPKAKKEVECEVMSVDLKSKTVSLKDMTTKVVHKSVAFSEIG